MSYNIYTFWRFYSWISFNIYQLCRGVVGGGGQLPSPIPWSKNYYAAHAPWRTRYKPSCPPPTLLHLYDWNIIGFDKGLHAFKKKKCKENKTERTDTKITGKSWLKVKITNSNLYQYIWEEGNNVRQKMKKI